MDKKEDHKLTDKQDMFCKEYIIDMNATQAAIKAGYSEKTATQTGYENMTKPYIVERIAELNKGRMERVQITADDVLRDLIKIKDKCMQDEPIMVYDRVDNDYKQKTDDDENKVYQFNATGATKALELIGKNLVMFTDKKEISVTAGVTIVDDIKGE